MKSRKTCVLMFVTRGIAEIMIFISICDGPEKGYQQYRCNGALVGLSAAHFVTFVLALYLEPCKS